MSTAYKNFWSLNIDEAVVAGILRNGTEKNIEVLMPLNAQMKGVDLYLINSINKKVVTIQVKGSKAYQPEKKEVRDFGDGSCGWFYFSEEVVDNATADFFIFLVYVIEEQAKKGRVSIEPHLILIPIDELKKRTHEYKKANGDGKLCYYIWINPVTKEAFDFRNKKMDLSDFLDKKGFEIIKKEL